MRPLGESGSNLLSQHLHRLPTVAAGTTKYVLVAKTNDVVSVSEPAAVFFKRGGGGGGGL